MSELSSMIDSFGDVAPGYLDWARFGPLSPAVRAEMLADAEMLGTGRSASIDLVEARSAEARDLLAQVLGAAADEIVLQPSTTHGLFHALFGLEGTVVLPAQDFPAVRLAAGRAAEARGALTVHEIDPPGGVVTADAVAAALTDEVTAVALSLVDFRTGALVDLAAVRDVVGDRLLIVDAIQGFGVTDVDWSAADVVAGNGYKWLRAGRGTGFARFSPRARERIAPLLSGISGMDGDPTTPGVPQPVSGVGAFSVAPADPLAASRLVASLREVIDVGPAVIADAVRARAREVMRLADDFGIPVRTPRDAHAGIVALAPDPSDAPALAAALANHGLTVTARGDGIRVATHVGTTDATLDELGHAIADAAARRAVTVDFGADLGAAPGSADIFTIEIPDAPAAPRDDHAGGDADAIADDAVRADEGDEGDEDIVVATVDDDSGPLVLDPDAAAWEATPVADEHESAEREADDIAHDARDGHDADGTGHDADSEGTGRDGHDVDHIEDDGHDADDDGHDRHDDHEAESTTDDPDAEHHPTQI